MKFEARSVRPPACGGQTEAQLQIRSYDHDQGVLLIFIVHELHKRLPIMQTCLPWSIKTPTMQRLFLCHSIMTPTMISPHHQSITSVFLAVTETRSRQSCLSYSWTSWCYKPRLANMPRASASLVTTIGRGRGRPLLPTQEVAGLTWLLLGDADEHFYGGKVLLLFMIVECCYHGIEGRFGHSLLLQVMVKILKI
jgi:hypothetical protein